MKGDNKGEEYWEDVLIEIKKNGVTNGVIEVCSGVL
jgi:hypothetical protein